jgi:hypothetical protein
VRKAMKVEELRRIDYRAELKCIRCGEEKYLSEYVGYEYVISPTCRLCRIVEFDHGPILPD